MPALIESLSAGFARALTNLTTENRSKIPPGQTNLQNYLQRDEMGEKSVIELETQHKRTPLTLGLQKLGGFLARVAAYGGESDGEQEELK